MSGPVSSRTACDRLKRLRDALRASAALRRGTSPPYAIPALWIDPDSTPGRLRVDPFDFYVRRIDEILSSPSTPALSRTSGSESSGRQWSRSAAVYDLFIRLACAYDHDGDGLLASGVSAEGWRETGTFLKAIALLPYIRSLGFDTIHLLPVQEIGLDGRRGDLGSPYAVRDPRAIDPALADPAAGVSPPEQFSAFVEAAHCLGLRVVLELPLRTQSKDCSWAEIRPDWFYWIRDGVEFRPPLFSPEDVSRAKEMLGRGEQHDLPAPPEGYRSMFTPPPAPGSVRREGVRLVGEVPGTGKVAVPGAFADWPPDDRQPVWDDVTYLKFHQDPRFNYPAYNTIRMYDSRLFEGGTETAGMRDALAGLVAWYAAEFGIDGLMVDMAHALPGTFTEAIISGAREVRPDFAFWAEDFSRTDEQVRAGYDAVLGGQWACEHRKGDFRDMLEWIGRTPELLPHLAAPETHNTPRAASREGGKTYARYAWEISCFIPGIPYLQGGFELSETAPVNTGLGFAPEDLVRFPAGVLPLFSARSLGWDAPGGLRSSVRSALRLRRRFAGSISAPGAPFRLIDAGNDRVIAFARSAPGGGSPILVAANADPLASATFRITGEPGTGGGTDLLGGGRFDAPAGAVGGALAPGQVAVFGEGGER